jgi:hypothetical protein
MKLGVATIVWALYGLRYRTDNNLAYTNSDPGYASGEVMI